MKTNLNVPDQLYKAYLARHRIAVRNDNKVLKFLKSKHPSGLTTTEISKLTGFDRSFLVNSLPRLESKNKVFRVKSPDQFFAKLINRWFYKN